jgi:hypothetical protein
MSKIYFYGRSDDYYCFSNFSHYPIIIDKKIYKTSEHYVQSKKFEGSEYEELIRLAKTPSIAAKIGRDRNLPLREDWEDVKEKIMYKALKAKFTQHEEIKGILLKTKNKEIIEHTSKDNYWGDGGDGKGKNRLGNLLMKLREELIKESQ